LCACVHLWFLVTARLFELARLGVCTCGSSCSPVHLNVPVLQNSSSCVSLELRQRALFAMCANQNCYGCQQAEAPKQWKRKHGSKHLLQAQLPDLPSPSLPAGRVVQGAPVTPTDRWKTDTPKFAPEMTERAGKNQPFLEIARDFSDLFSPPSA
jgi:hypothetical protein